MIRCVGCQGTQVTCPVCHGHLCRVCSPGMSFCCPAVVRRDLPSGESVPAPCGGVEGHAGDHHWSPFLAGLTKETTR